MNQVLFPHWKKNEILRPSSFLGLWVVVILCLIALMVTIITPVNAVLDRDTYYTLYNPSPSSDTLKPHDNLTLQSLNISAVNQFYSLTNYANTSGYNYNTAMGQPDGTNTSSIVVGSILHIGDFPDNPAMSGKAYANVWMTYGSLYYLLATWKYSNTTVGLNSSYTNLTVNVKAIGTSTNIQYATVYKWNYDGSVSTGITNSAGNVTLNYLTTNATPTDLDVFAVGFNYYTEKYALTNSSQFKQVYLTPTGAVNSTNYIRVNVLDATTSQYIPNVNITVTDKNVSQSYYIISSTGSENIVYTGTSKNRQLYFNDYYNFEAAKTGYVTNNLTIRYTSAGMTADVYLTPESLVDSGLELWLDIIDGATGYTIGGAGYQIYDNQYSQWFNSTTATGQVAITRTGTFKQYPILIGKNYTLCGSGSGYNGGCTYTQSFGSPYSLNGTGKQPYIISLTYSGNVPIGNFSCNVYTIGTNNLAIPNVAVLSSNGQGHTTTNAGVTQFILPAGTYQFTAHKDGYFDAVGTITGAAGESKSLTLQLVSGATTPTITPTIIPTIVGYNSSGFEEVACVHYPYPEDWNAWQIMKNNIACFGVEGKTAQNLMLALLIIMFCAMAGASKAKGMGFVGGGIIGSGITFGLGILPIWILVFIIIVCGLILAGMIYGKK